MFRPIFAILFFIFLFAGFGITSAESVATGFVVRVFDGDTLLVRIEGRYEKVRLVGIDTPEKDGPYTTLEPYGNEATARTMELALKKVVKLSYGGSTMRDKYKRLLAHVTLPDGRILNEILLNEGFAEAYRKFSYTNKEKYLELERRARKKCKGLWKLKKPCLK